MSKYIVASNLTVKGVGGQEYRTKVQDGHLMAYTDPNRPGGGIWRHACETEAKCGNYIVGEYYDKWN